MNKLNKELVIAGIILVALANIMIQKYALFDLPAFDKCLAYDYTAPLGTVVQGCAEVDIMPFWIGWVVAAAGFGILIYGLKADRIPKSRLV